MTNNQWSKVVERLHKYREVRLPDGNILVLWESGDVSLRDGKDGHCIAHRNKVDEIKPLYVD